MPIIQTNTYICELCRKVEQRAQEVGPYDDPVVELPQDWGYLKRKLPHTELEYFACPECMAQPDKHFEGVTLTPGAVP